MFYIGNQINLEWSAVRMVFRNGIIILTTLSLVACTSADMERLKELSNETLGTAGGTVVGGAVGGLFGKGKGKLVAVGLGAAIGGVIGNQVGAYLDRRDKAELQQQAALSLETKPDGQTSTWKNAESGVSGTITPKDTRTVTKNTPIARDRAVAAPPSLDLIGEEFYALKSANIRSGPTTSSASNGSLAAGQSINVVGQVSGQDWYMVARDGRSVGYVATFLLKPNETQQSDATLVSTQQVAYDLDQFKRDDTVVVEAVSTQTQCKELNYTINISTKQQEEKGSFEACKGSDGAWVLDDEA